MEIVIVNFCIQRRPEHVLLKYVYFNFLSFKRITQLPDWNPAARWFLFESFKEYYSFDAFKDMFLRNF